MVFSLNLVEDPIKVLKHSTDTMNSVLKIFIDIFSIPETAGMFYTNDNKVLIDIIVRQLTDLCAGNPVSVVCLFVFLFFFFFFFFDINMIYDPWVYFLKTS